MIRAIAAVAGLTTAWLAYRVRRNRSLERPPIRDADGAPFPTIAVTLSDGEVVDALDTGTGPALLLIPGADGIRETWRYQVVDLAREYRVVSADLRTGISADHTFDRLALDAAEVCAARGVDSCVVVGQSLGGAIAMRLAASRPELVRGVVISNSLARVSYEAVGLNRTLLIPVAMATSRYLPTVLAAATGRLWNRLCVWIFDSSPGGGRIIDYMLWTGPRTVPPAVSRARVRLLAAEDLGPELATIRVPALVVKGPLDTYLPVSWARDIAARIPDAVYEEVPGTGHCSHISMPEVFNRILLEWLSRIDEAAPAVQRPGKEAEA
ncbi:MAG: alpha/beta fold hydrolase [Gemmatimonadota bacterium]